MRTMIKKDTITQGLLITIFIIFSFVYYQFPVFLPQIDKIYITATTFFFSIFTGFFISQQVQRYSKIRETVSIFDGKMSSIYRSAGNVSQEMQDEIGAIIANHYSVLLETKEWDYHFTHKSETLKNIHDVMEQRVANDTLSTLRTHSLARIITNLSDCEVTRKSLVTLYQERIPTFQWFIIIFFILVLLTAVSAIPSNGVILESILKSAYGVSLFSVASILHHLDSLHLFEDFIGENSAKDVLGIMKGEK